MKKSPPPIKKSTLAISLLLGAVISGCGGTQFRQTPQSSGFLGTYSQLKPLPGRSQALFYENQQADWSNYTQVLIEPVRILSKGNVNIQSMSLRDRRLLGTYFEYSMRDALQEKYHVVTQAGPGVLRVRAAITNITSADALINRIGSSIVQIPGGFGEVTLEGEVVDSVTGDRLAAIVDGQAGSLFESYKEWEDVTQAFDGWAEQLYSVIYKNLGDIPLDTSSHAIAKTQSLPAAVQVASAAPTPIPVLAAAVVEAEFEAFEVEEVVVVAQPKPKPKPKAMIKKAMVKQIAQAPKAKVKPIVKAKPAPTIAEKTLVVAKSPKPKTKPTQVAMVKEKAKEAMAAKTMPKKIEEKAQAVVTPLVASKPKPAPKPVFDPWNGKPGTGNANINEANLRPFILGLKTQGSVKEVVEAAIRRLKSNGFSIAGQYTPQSNATIIIATNSTLQKHAAQSEFGAYGAAVRVSVTTTGGDVQVSYTNPNYMNAIYRMKGSLSGVASKLATTLGKIKTFGSKDGIEDDDLRDWHYTFAMPYFDDPLELASHDSYQSAVNKVAASLKSGKAGVKQIYRIDVPGKDETVFGVAFSKGTAADKSILEAIDVEPIKHTAHLPYELVVSGDKVYALDGKFRIALSFPDLTMGQFVGIRNAPDAIEEALEEIAK